MNLGPCLKSPLATIRRPIKIHIIIIHEAKSKIQLFSQMIFLFTIFAFVKFAKADQLDEAIASAIFRPTSTKCTGAGSSTSFSASYSSTMSTSKWHSLQETYEPDVFEIDMIHSDENENRTWALRIGKGGHISSLIVKAGEVVANEEHSSSFWNDLVPQMIAVNGALNTNTNPNFIHQAGPYTKDTGMPPPFYSPKLALDCSGNSCSTVNWGMQAHVPTPHDSAILYYTRYRDCGSGIIEYDMVMHHFGQNSTDIYDYLDVPWTALRTSTYRDMMIADQTGKLIHQYPLLNFGVATTQIRDLDTTGGFTTFVQNLPTPVENYDLNVCVDPSKISIVPSDNIVANVPCNSSDPNQYPFTFVVSSGGPNAQATMHYIDYKLSYTVKMDLCNLQAPITISAPNLGKAFEGVLMVNTRTGFAFVTEYIIHFCWAKANSYFHSNVTADVLNAQFQAGDVIAVKYIQPTTRVEDQLAMTFVHGTNPEYPNSFYRGKSRLWYGLTNKIRDGTVWDVNLIGRLRQTETYYNRKYIIIDQLGNMEYSGIDFRDETFEDVDAINELPPGQSISLWMNSTSFGASIGNSSCQNPSAAVACTGSSTPKMGFNPWFYIICGANIITSSDPYHFSVFINEFKKPYLCNGEPNSTRAVWKILGYFSDCSSISSKVYVSSFCPNSSETEGAQPTYAASDNPSQSPSSNPSLIPSDIPSLMLSESPSVNNVSLNPSISSSDTSVEPSLGASAFPNHLNISFLLFFVALFIFFLI